MDKNKGASFSDVFEMDFSAVVVIEAFDAFGKGLRLREGGTTDQCRKDKDHAGMGFHAGDLLLRSAEPGMVNDKWTPRLVPHWRKRLLMLLFDDQQAHEVLMARATACIAIERKGANPFGDKLNHLRRSGKDGPRINSKMQELQTMGDVLSQDTKPHPLSLLDPDLGRAPASALEGPRHKKDLPGPFMRRFAEIMRVENGQGKN